MCAGRTVGEGDDEAHASALDDCHQIVRSSLGCVFRHVSRPPKSRYANHGYTLPLYN
jgi:hypothetical protein